MDDQQNIELSNALSGGASNFNTITTPVEYGVPALLPADQTVNHDPSDTYNPTDDGAARRLADRHHPHELLFDDISQQWYRFDSSRWLAISARELENEVVALGDEYKKDAWRFQGKAAQERLSFATQLESQRSIEQVVKAAKRHCTFDGQSFDADPYAFNVENGTLLLDDVSEIVEHDYAHWITKRAGACYDPETTCPRWAKFIDWLADRDSEIVAFLQELLGTALIGQNPDRVIIVLHGPGKNGKSVILKIMRAIFGDYGQDAPSDLLMQKSAGGASPELARMKGVRLLCLDDPDIGNAQTTAIDNLKRLSGDQNIVGRALYGKHTEFRGVMTPLIAWNKVPDLHGGGGNAIWDRLAMFEFHKRPAKADPNLEAKLLSEREGILNWLIEGFERRSKRGGLLWPNAILDTKQSLRDKKDSAGEFVQRRVTSVSGQRVKANDLYAAYEAWCKAHQLDLHDRRRLKHCMEQAGYAQRKISTMQWIDAELLTP